jgi:hypothetical protein
MGTTYTFAHFSSRSPVMGCGRCCRSICGLAGDENRSPRAQTGPQPEGMVFGLRRLKRQPAFLANRTQGHLGVKGWIEIVDEPKIRRCFTDGHDQALAVRRDVADERVFKGDLHQELWFSSRRRYAEQPPVVRLGVHPFPIVGPLEGKHPIEMNRPLGCPVD